MRRGLIEWNPQDYSEQRLDNTIDAALRQLEAQQLDAIVAYTDHSRPSLVWAFTQFVPYWANGAVVISRTHRAALLVTLSKRGTEWVRHVSRTDHCHTTPSLSQGIPEYFQEHIASSHRRIGVIDLENTPQELTHALVSAMPGAELVDLSFWYRTQVADASLPTALRARALQIAQDALQEVSTSSFNDAYELVSLIDGSCRSAGAEEVHLTIAPDLARSSTLVRPEGLKPLGERYAVQIAMAYKGLWIRLGQTWNRGTPETLASNEQHWLDQWMQQLQSSQHALHNLNQPLRACPPELHGTWMLERQCNGLPLTPLAFGTLHGPVTAHDTPLNSQLFLTLNLQSSRGAWHLATAL